MQQVTRNHTSTHLLLITISFALFQVLNSYEMSDSERNHLISDLSMAFGGGYYKKSDPSWKYIGLGKRTEHSDDQRALTRRTRINRFGMIGLGR
ncbi:unnamed protein product [Anisakis simplex]|uniref:Uncharacterized protein n=1 Tax=Anisakis simplex TaxID=6269 RepID=A0A0M3K6G8_ANISI|nr:unnamed protein product [Anisakis simplex]